MATIERREFLKAAAAATVGGVVLGTATTPSRAWPDAQERRYYKLFPMKPLPQPRPAENVELMFKAPRGLSQLLVG